MRSRVTLIFALMSMAFLDACAGKAVKSTHSSLEQKKQVMEGIASWYGRRFHGRRTASGERYNMYLYTTAHRNLPFGTWLAVTNPANNKTIHVRVNDRGPYVGNRILDLSYAAAKALGIVKRGTALVKVWVVGTVSLGD